MLADWRFRLNNLSLNSARAHTFRECGTAHEFPAAAKLNDHGFPALWAGEFRGCVLERRQLINMLFRLHIFLERPVKILERLFILASAACNLIELVFHFCRKGVADVLGEISFKERAYHIPRIGREK